MVSIYRQALRQPKSPLTKTITLPTKTVLHSNAQISFSNGANSQIKRSTTSSISGLRTVELLLLLMVKTFVILLTKQLLVMHRGNPSRSHTRGKGLIGRKMFLRGCSRNMKCGIVIHGLYSAISLQTRILRMKLIMLLFKSSEMMAKDDGRTLCLEIGRGVTQYVFHL